MIVRRYRIYQVAPGRWVCITRDPSGGVLRQTYPSGQAALIALDGRNRPRTGRPKAGGDFLSRLLDALFRPTLTSTPGAVSPRHPR